MQLDEFIRNTLTQILAGVSGAAEELGHDRINPPLAKAGVEQLAASGYLLGRRGHIVQQVEFDVAVTTRREGGGSAGVSIEVLGVGVEASGKGERAGEAHSRVRFRVPVALPVMNPSEAVAKGYLPR